MTRRVRMSLETAEEVEHFAGFGWGAKRIAARLELNPHTVADYLRVPLRARQAWMETAKFYNLPLADVAARRLGTDYTMTGPTHYGGPSE